jgi:glycolate oxidase
MMDGPAIRAVEAYAHCGYPADAAALLLCELDGLAADVAADVASVEGILTQAGATQLRRARDAAARAQLWSGRKAAFPAIGRLAPDYYCMDGTIPRRHLPAVLAGIGELSAAHGLRVANVFHAGDGNLHPLIMFDAGRPGDIERAERMGAEILELCIAAGGTVTGEHGVGVEKLGPMCSQFGSEELSAFHAVKRAFDPRGLLNPGKAIPTLARCADYGAMRVQGGQLPFPDLPRF